MTPHEKHGHDLPYEVIVHELGHAIVGHELGITEGGIEICDPSSNEVARAHFNANGATVRMRIVRGLAGAFTQAKVARGNLPVEISRQILDGSIFADNVAHIESGTFPPEILHAGFYGDWESVVLAATEKAKKACEIVRELEGAHRDLVSIYEEQDVENKVKLVAEDFQLWLHQHDDDVPFMELLIYPVTRMRKKLVDETDKRMASNG